jgi:hypothetical protein
MGDLVFLDVQILCDQGILGRSPEALNIVWLPTAVQIVGAPQSAS